MQITSLDSPVEIRQAAAVNFKNFVKYYWVSSSFLAYSNWTHCAFKSMSLPKWSTSSQLTIL